MKLNKKLIIISFIVIAFIIYILCWNHYSQIANTNTKKLLILPQNITPAISIIKNPIDPNHQFHRINFSWDTITHDFSKIISDITNYDSPRNATTRKETDDLNNNAIPEIYTLINGQLTITENADTYWQSSLDWWVDNFVLADVNTDGIIEISLSVWKAGNFGSSQPFWIKENDMSVKNHFFIFTLLDKTVKPLWQSSNLEVPNCEFFIADIDYDGKNDLIVNEGDYTKPSYCNGHYIALWKWNGWGFSNEWRSEKGNYVNMKLQQNDTKTSINVDAY